MSPFEPSKLFVRKAAWEDAAEVGEILVGGFHDSPFWDCIDLQTKHPEAEMFFFKQWARIMFGNSFLILYDDQVIGHYSITPENDSGPTFWRLMQYGFYQPPFRYGWEFTTHAMDLVDSSCCTRDHVLSRRPPVVMLDAFAIKQEWRGRGIGKHILKQFILQGHSRMVLLAHEKKAVDLYEKVGFRTLDQRVVRTSYNREYENWVMENEVL
ncbi:hypothetical protein Poli38472_004956 [Pythium oligandrum]|uniref:N-acetyltransferase domain-containing protein n=1 Tax=Pythium oligandrum TaxID=41045 RepID=A0A8K1CB16_PYTOL|nr:hypothetical protein Poli38472_004956 [Pythium oligandrum]|eukprot:TMW59887.1 hypothetical protein Poli38472_004956 [Pythium oligandrum]